MSREEKCFAVKHSWLSSEKEYGRCKLLSEFMTMREKNNWFSECRTGFAMAMHIPTMPKNEKKKNLHHQSLVRSDCEIKKIFILVLLKLGYYGCNFLFGNPGLFLMSKWTFLETSTSSCRCALRREMVARCIKKTDTPCLVLTPVFVLHTK
jgi:hypothetical protein